MPNSSGCDGSGHCDACLPGGISPFPIVVGIQARDRLSQLPPRTNRLTGMVADAGKMKKAGDGDRKDLLYDERFLALAVTPYCSICDSKRECYYYVESTGKWTKKAADEHGNRCDACSDSDSGKPPNLVPYTANPDANTNRDALYFMEATDVAGTKKLVIGSGKVMYKGALEGANVR
jgi:hypothetical protein